MKNIDEVEQQRSTISGSNSGVKNGLISYENLLTCQGVVSVCVELGGQKNRDTDPQFILNQFRCQYTLKRRSLENGPFWAVYGEI